MVSSAVRPKPTLIIISLLILFGLNALLGGTIVLNFQGQPGYNQVTLKWTSQNEINLKGFDIERSFEKTGSKDYKKIAFLAATPENKDKKEYSYKDTSVFKSNERTFHYRLKILDKDGKYSYSKSIAVTPTVSSARQTWGSIKAMFR